MKVEDETRRGLLGQASILAVTSYATRTSPVLRVQVDPDQHTRHSAADPAAEYTPAKGKRAESDRPLTVRERMEEHRRNPACAGCHSTMDPLGFALENFDAVGKWRTRGEDGARLDASGVLPDGANVDGPASLRNALLSHSDQVVSTLAEKLLTFALGRGP